MLKKISIVLVSFVFISMNTYALTIKVGALAPAGTKWAKNMKKMAKAIKKATDGQVKIKIYFGGSQGDEHDVLRKIRVGQLQGGVFTGKTLGDINGDVRVLELPFNFKGDRAKAWKSVQMMSSFLNKGFEKKEFVNLGFFEIGDVYLISQKKVTSLDDLKGLKIWSWEGDELVSEMIRSMKLVSVPLPLPDVLSSLSTGIIKAAYAPPFGIIALQWNTKIKYLVDLPISYSVGAFLIENKKWNKISDQHKKIVRELSVKYIAEINKGNIEDNRDSLIALKKMGIEFQKLPAKDLERGNILRKEVISKLKGKLFSADAFNMLEKSL